MRSGLMSTPTPLAPYVFAAAITMRPSPQPRSYTVSPALTPASFNIPSTTGFGLGTYGTSRRGAVVWAAATVKAKRAAAAIGMRIDDLRSREYRIRGLEA